MSPEEFESFDKLRTKLLEISYEHVADIPEQDGCYMAIKALEDVKDRYEKRLSELREVET